MKHSRDELPQNEYQLHLEEEHLFGSDGGDVEGTDRDYLALDPPRYWSDFNRVLYTPKSLHQIPSASMLRDSGDSWNLGHLLYSRYNRVRHVFIKPQAYISNIS